MQIPTKGTLLIAEPFLKDPNFSRTVILLCEHKEEGSFGFVLNRFSENNLAELMPEQAFGLELPVFCGGPVQQETLHFLHQHPEKIPGGLAIGDGVYWGGDFGVAVQQLRSGSINEKEIRFFIGYSGWSGGQLENELQENSWITVKAKRNLIFDHHPNEIWKQSLLYLGGKYEIMINFPIDPALN